MMPQQYIDHLRELIGAGRNEDALEFAARFGEEVMPRLNAEQLDRVTSLLEGAEMAVGFKARLQEQQPVATK